MAASRAASAAEEEEDAAGGVPLSVVSFNLLAPCYFRVEPDAADDDIAMDGGGGSSSAAAGSSATRRRVEAQYRGSWSVRLAQAFALLAEVDADVIALQELWCVPDVIALLRASLGARYAFHAARRRGGKEDGVALLVRKATWSVADVRTVNFEGAGDRVLLVALLEPAGAAPPPLHAPAHGAAGGGGGGGGGGDAALAALLASTRAALAAPRAAPPPPPRRVVVATTHLTYPHDEFDAELRLAQAQAACRAVDAFVDEVVAATAVSSVVHQLHGAVATAGGRAGAAAAASDDTIEVDTTTAVAVPVIFAGDFNHDSDDALAAVRAAGYKSAYALAHHGDDPTYTHVDHTGAAGCVDYIFARTATPGASRAAARAAGLDDTVLAVAAAELLPSTLPHAVASPRPAMHHFAARRGGGGGPAAAPLALAAMSPADWHALSDHRPLYARFRVR